MLVEQYPVSENFRLGLSEHFSMNSYRVIDDPGCCSISDVYADYYKEFGALLLAGNPIIIDALDFKHRIF